MNVVLLTGNLSPWKEDISENEVRFRKMDVSNGEKYRIPLISVELLDQTMPIYQPFDFSVI